VLNWQSDLMETISPQPTPQETQPNVHWPSVWQFGLSLFGILALWGFSATMLLVALSSILTGDTVGALVVLLNAAGTAFAGLLLIPSAGYALLHLLGKPDAFRFQLRHPGWVILALPPVLLLGHWAANTDIIAYFLLPFMHVLAAAISVAWLLTLGLRGLSLHSPQLGWGVFSCGLVGAPLLSLITELAVLIFLVILGMFYLAQEPQVLDALLNLTQTMPPDAPETAVEILQPYVTQPGTLFVVFTFGSLLVPLLEELFKPIGVWLLAWRQPTQAQGFAAGLISGAGYALFENFALGASAGNDWAVVILARMGTSLIHILTTGLMGWALVLAWREQRYLRLMATYFLAVAIHGAWNGMVILTAVVDLSSMDVAIPEILQIMGTAAPLIFALLIGLCLLLLLGSNAILRRKFSSEDDIIPPAQLQNEPQIENDEKEILSDGNYYQSD
jgi:hypothetical protein